MTAKYAFAVAVGRIGPPALLQAAGFYDSQPKSACSCRALGKKITATPLLSYPCGNGIMTAKYAFAVAVGHRTACPAVAGFSERKSAVSYKIQVNGQKMIRGKFGNKQNMQTKRMQKGWKQ